MLLRLLNTALLTRQGGGGSGRWRLYVLLLLDISLCGSRARVWGLDRARDGGFGITIL